jgi:ABC-type multidrug transport system permease subunit
MKPESLQYKESPDAWQTKVQQLSRLPFPLPWMLIAGVLFAIGYAITLNFNDSPNTVRLLALKSVLIAAIASSVIFYEKLLDGVADTFPLVITKSLVSTIFGS